MEFENGSWRWEDVPSMVLALVVIIGLASLVALVIWGYLPIY